MSVVAVRGPKHAIAVDTVPGDMHGQQLYQHDARDQGINSSDMCYGSKYSAVLARIAFPIELQRKIATGQHT